MKKREIVVNLNYLIIDVIDLYMTISIASSIQKMLKESRINSLRRSGRNSKDRKLKKNIILQDFFSRLSSVFMNLTFRGPT